MNTASAARRIGVMTLCVLLMCVGFTAPAAAGRASVAAQTPSWLARINAVRADAGLGRVTADRSGVDGIKRHLRYLQKTPSKYLRGEYASAHTENPKSPYYTQSGAREGGSSDLTFGSSSELDAINVWLAAPFHAIGMLRASLTAVAFYRDPGTGYAGLDVLSHNDGTAVADVVFPRSHLDLSGFGGGESPDPIETCRHDHPKVDWSSPSFPVIAMPKTMQTANGITATIRTPSRTTLRSSSTLCLVSAATYYSTDHVYGPTGKDILQYDNAILLVAPHRFANGRYAVHLDLGAQNAHRVLDWSFDMRAPLPTPRLSDRSARCAYPASPTSGSMKFRVTNRTGSRVHYAAQIGSRRVNFAVRAHATAAARITQLAAGRRVLVVRGSDGTHTAGRVAIKRCSVWRSASASARTKTHTSRRVTVLLNNSRNVRAVKFSVRAGDRAKLVRVSARHQRKITMSLPRGAKTVVTVTVSRHRILERSFRR